jgi:CBS domain-containing protein
MKARDVMVSPVVTVNSSATVQQVAKTLLERRVSAVPVVDDDDKLVGIISEGDLLHRAEAGTERQRPWWLAMLTDSRALAADYVKAHARKVKDIMTTPVITATPDAPLHQIATLLESHSIKRVPIVEHGQLVGIVSRANLIQAVASELKEVDIPRSDATVRERLLAHLKTQSWAHTTLVNITVSEGVVDLWGISNSDVERQALRVAAESLPGVRAVNDHMIKRPQAWGY